MRRRRRLWKRDGRAHIEVRGAHLAELRPMARCLERELSGLEGIDWAAVNQATARVVVSFDEDQVDLETIIDVIEGVEALHDAEAGFPTQRPEHPGDLEPLRRQRWALAADALGFGTGMFTGVLRRSSWSAEVAALIGLVEGTPPLRRPLEERFGPAADAVLAATHAFAQAFAGSPLSLAVDAAHRLLVLAELRTRLEFWERLEPELHEGAAGRVDALSQQPRPLPIPLGELERHAEMSAIGTFVGAIATLVGSRDPRLAVATTVAGNAKAARLGRESFAAALSVLLSERGVLPMDREVLRRLDRVDTVVLDADVLVADRWTVGAVWTPADRAVDEAEVWLVSRLLFDPEAPRATQRGDGWTLAPLGSGAAARGIPSGVLRGLRRSGGVTLALHDTRGLAAVVEAAPQLDPFARAVARAAQLAGTTVVAGRQAGVASRLGIPDVIAGGSQLTAGVRALQQEGRVVAVVSARQPGALAAADVGIGVRRKAARVPWGADLITSRGLLDAWLVLAALPTARAVTGRSVKASAYGSGAAELLALAGPRRGATRRAGLAVNGATAVSVAGAAWSARALRRAPEPVPDETSDWHAITSEEALARLRTRPEGLTAAEVEERVVAAAQIEPESEAAQLLYATVEELGNPLTPPLAGGAGLSAALGSVLDAGLIGSVMALNALIGGIQRVGADRAVERLLDASNPRVHVRRDAADLLLPADQLVLGDMVSVRAGDVVPADCRIATETGLEANEASLTGESQPVLKRPEATLADAVAERHSMLYAGTEVAAGEARAVVVAVGDATEMGRSGRVAGEARRSGVETRLRHLTSQTVPVALGAGAAVVGAGLLRGRQLAQTLSTGVGLAVAAVPEGLPVVATVAQLASARRLSERNALVRHHSTIEALGRVDMLCADKTGTLTSGHIALRLVSDGSRERGVDALDAPALSVLAAAIRATPHGGSRQVPHPTDRAVLDGAARAGVDEQHDAADWRLDSELPFAPDRGYHAVLGQVAGELRVIVKGAPEVLLPRCGRWRRDGTTLTLDDQRRGEVAAHVDRLARSGYRVLAVAERPARDPGDLSDRRISRLELLGLLAMADPVRPSAAEAVASLRAAGVGVVMVTGDHPSTAEAIAAELGLLDDTAVVTGPELEAMSDRELEERVDSVAVFARVAPTQKVRIVQALQRRGRVVAMTGDGANDAAAIRLADVGVALGAEATNAAKQAADVVVADDRIETIIDAILEGRAMWASVRDAVAVLVGGNLGEIAFTLGTELLYPRGCPLNARQLLLINLFTDLVPALALAVRPPAGTDPDTLLAEGPEASLGSALTRDVLVRGAVTAAAGGFGWQAGRLTGPTRARAGTVALVSLVGSQLGQTLVAGWRSPLVVGSTLASGAALAAVVQTPGVSHLFGCRPLGPVGWGIGAAAAATSSVAAPVIHRILDAAAPRTP